MYSHLTRGVLTFVFGFLASGAVAAAPTTTTSAAPP